MTTIICKIKQKRGDRKKNPILKNEKAKAKIEEADTTFVFSFRHKDAKFPFCLANAAAVCYNIMGKTQSGCRRSGG